MVHLSYCYFRVIALTSQSHFYYSILKLSEIEIALALRAWVGCQGA